MPLCCPWSLKGSHVNAWDGPSFGPDWSIPQTDEWVTANLAQEESWWLLEIHDFRVIWEFFMESSNRDDAYSSELSLISYQGSVSVRAQQQPKNVKMWLFSLAVVGSRSPSCVTEKHLNVISVKFSHLFECGRWVRNEWESLCFHCSTRVSR